MNSPELSGHNPKIDGIEAQEINAEQAFNSRFSQIMERSLSPENIDTYAEDALKDLITLVVKCAEAYASSEHTDLTGKELEDVALKHYGLPNIPHTLDYISQKAGEIKHLDKLIENAIKIDSVIVPPKDQEAQITPGEGTFKEKLTIARTKTALFILANDFDINIDEPKQLKMTAGVLNDNMMRKLGYTMIEIPSLNRIILCCDEEGNITYVIDTDQVIKEGLDVKSFINKTKQEIDELINSNPEIGTRIIYSRSFTANIVEQIQEIRVLSDEKNNETTRDHLGNYLYPKAPRDHLSIYGLATKLNVSPKTINEIIQDLGDSLGTIGMYRYALRTKPNYGLSLKQQAIITQELHDKEYLIEKAPEDTLPIQAIAKSLGLADGTISKAIYELGDKLGKIKKYKYGSNRTFGFTTRQISLIEQYLQEKGTLTEVAPENTYSIAQIATKLDVSHQVIDNAIRALEEELGEIKTYKFQRPVPGLSEKQIGIITYYLHEKGSLAEEAPEDVFSIAQIASKLGVSHKIVDSAIDALKDHLGELEVYKFHGRPSIGFNLKQLSIITQYLDEQGSLAEKAPIRFLSCYGISKSTGIAESAIKNAINELGDNIGKTQKYRFRSQLATGYSPDQVTMIVNYAKRNKQ